jgi:hypothetical protein
LWLEETKISLRFCAAWRTASMADIGSGTTLLRHYSSHVSSEVLG